MVNSLQVIGEKGFSRVVEFDNMGDFDCRSTFASKVVEVRVRLGVIVRGDGYGR